MSFQEYAEKAGRLKDATFHPRMIVGAVVLVIAALVIIAFALVPIGGGSEPLAVTKQDDQAAQIEAKTDSGDAEPAKICVYVSGCVAAPGVCYLDEGSRVADAVAAAGGMTPEAAPDAVNLARLLTDGEQVRIVAASEAMEAEEGKAQPADGSTAQAAVQSGGKININTATLQELQTLKGIGASKAQKIIDYREQHGAFKSVDELTDVSGIGDKTLEAIRDSICA